QLPEGRRQQNLEGHGRRRTLRPGAVPATERLALPGPAGEPEVPARRRDSRHVSRPAAQTARNRTRCVRLTTTTGSPRPATTRPRPSWPQRRHPGLESGDQAPSRALVNGYSRESSVAEEAARVDQPAGLPQL